MDNNETTCETCSTHGVSPEQCYRQSRRDMQHKAERVRSYYSSKLGA